MSSPPGGELDVQLDQPAHLNEGTPSVRVANNSPDARGLKYDSLAAFPAH